MVFKLGELEAVVNALQGILNQRLPVKAAYWLGKFLKKAQAELADFQEARARVWKQYCRKDDKGTPIMLIEGKKGAWVEAKEGYRGAYRYDFAHLIPEEVAVFNKEIADLTDTEATFEGLKPLTLDQLGDKLEATPQEMYALDALIGDGEAKVVEPQ
jgi:hypothetical protein